LHQPLAEGKAIPARGGRRKPEAKLRVEEHEPHKRLHQTGELA
jgi:hypothetical protein